MTWRWRFWRPLGNGEAAKHATEQARETLGRAHQQSRQGDRVADRARDLTRRSDWFTQEMEQALHLRRGT